jgi:hypothetical protein
MVVTPTAVVVVPAHETKIRTAPAIKNAAAIRLQCFALNLAGASYPVAAPVFLP